MERITNEELRNDFKEKLGVISNTIKNALDVRVYYVGDHGHSLKWPELTQKLEKEGTVVVRLSDSISALEVGLFHGGSIVEEKSIPFARVCMVKIRIHIGVAVEEQFWFPRGGGRLIPFVND